MARSKACRRRMDAAIKERSPERWAMHLRRQGIEQEPAAGVRPAVDGPASSRDRAATPRVNRTWSGRGCKGRTDRRAPRISPTPPSLWPTLPTRGPSLLVLERSWLSRRSMRGLWRARRRCLQPSGVFHAKFVQGARDAITFTSTLHYVRIAPQHPPSTRIFNNRSPPRRSTGRGHKRRRQIRSRPILHRHQLLELRVARSNRDALRPSRLRSGGAARDR